MEIAEVGLRTEDVFITVARPGDQIIDERSSKAEGKRQKLASKLSV
jgi:hypothetical protein